GGLVSSGDQTLGGVLFGVDVRREGEVTTLLSTLREGRAPRAGAFEVAMGSEMARQLDVKVGDQVVLVAAAADGSMGNDLFTLAGVFSTGTPALDASHVLVPLPDLQYLLAMDPGRVHEVALTTTRPWDTPVIAASVERSLSAFGPPLRVRPWTELRPELAESVELMGSMNWVIIVIVFAMAIFGVANTMIIGTFERRKEFAVVRALGTTPLGVGKTVVYEGIFLGVLALAAGAVVTGPVLVWWHNRPPDLSGIVGGFAWSGSMWRPILRVEYSWDTPIVAAVALFVTSVLAAVYPAWKATRVPPADALAD
ncbi:MAG: FtsX-like permease family protein, partial [Gemmatimonadota bacterium]|nr:FtsX-like permease family protein [Gemmatimonadota bacterium]